MQPQPQQVHGSAIRVINPGPSEERLKRNKKVIKTLGVIEALLGTICCLLGLAVIISINTGGGGFYISKDFGYQPYLYATTGEGLWGGIWVIIAGALGIACGTKKIVLPCLDHIYAFGFACEAAMAVLGFITLALCITSACLCCCASPVDVGSSSCCTCCPGSYQILEDNQLGYVMAGQENVPVMQPHVTQTGQGMQTQQPYQVVNRPPAYDHTVAQQSTAYETKRQDESEEPEMDPSYADDVCLLQDI